MTLILHILHIIGLQLETEINSECFRPRGPVVPIFSAKAFHTLFFLFPLSN